MNHEQILMIELLFELNVFLRYKTNFMPLIESKLLANEYIQTLIIKLPENTSRIKLEYIDLIQNRDYTPSFDCYVLKTIPKEEKHLFQYLKNPLNFIKFTILNSPIPIKRVFEMKSNNAKSLVIIFTGGKGRINISTA